MTAGDYTQSADDAEWVETFGDDTTTAEEGRVPLCVQQLIHDTFDLDRDGKVVITLFEVDGKPDDTIQFAVNGGGVNTTFYLPIAEAGRLAEHLLKVAALAAPADDGDIRCRLLDRVEEVKAKQPGRA